MNTIPHQRWASTSINVPETMIYTNPKGKQSESKTLTKTGNIAAKLKEKAFKLIPTSNPQQPDLTKHHNWASLSIDIPKTLTYTNAKGKETQANPLTKTGNIAIKTKQKAIKLVPVHINQKPELAKAPKVKVIRKTTKQSILKDIPPKPQTIVQQEEIKEETKSIPSNTNIKQEETKVMSENVYIRAQMLDREIKQLDILQFDSFGNKLTKEQSSYKHKIDQEYDKIIDQQTSGNYFVKYAMSLKDSIKSKLTGINVELVNELLEVLYNNQYGVVTEVFEIHVKLLQAPKKNNKIIAFRPYSVFKYQRGVDLNHYIDKYGVSWDLLKDIDKIIRTWITTILQGINVCIKETAEQCFPAYMYNMDDDNLKKYKKLKGWTTYKKKGLDIDRKLGHHADYETPGREEYEYQYIKLELAKAPKPQTIVQQEEIKEETKSIPSNTNIKQEETKVMVHGDKIKFEYKQVPGSKTTIQVEFNGRTTKLDIDILLKSIKEPKGYDMQNPHIAAYYAYIIKQLKLDLNQLSSAIVFNYGVFANLVIFSVTVNTDIKLINEISKILAKNCYIKDFNPPMELLNSYDKEFVQQYGINKIQQSMKYLPHINQNQKSGLIVSQLPEDQFLNSSNYNTIVHQFNMIYDTIQFPTYQEVIDAKMIKIDGEYYVSFKNMHMANDAYLTLLLSYLNTQNVPYHNNLTDTYFVKKQLKLGQVKKFIKYFKHNLENINKPGVVQLLAESGAIPLYYIQKTDDLFKSINVKQTLKVQVDIEDDLELVIKAR